MASLHGIVSVTRNWRRQGIGQQLIHAIFEKARRRGVREVFLEKHGEILEAGWWRALQERLAAGDLVEVLPYHPHRVRVASSL